MQIITSDHLKPEPAPASDSLLFTYAKNDKFTVKKAYQLFKANEPRGDDRKFWAWVWKDSGLLPKLQMFIWRCVFNAVPVQAVLAARIRALSPTCQLCGGRNETVMHAIFHCQFARAAWISSPLGVRTDRFMGNFKETITEAITSLSARDIVSFVSMAWAVWRVRNDAIYGNKRPSLTTCQEYFRKTDEASQVLILCKGVPQAGYNQLVCQQIQEGRAPQMPSGEDHYLCHVDGSWSQDGRAGLGVYISKGGEAIEWRSESIQAVSASQAEVRAILEGYKILAKYRDAPGAVLSDSMEAVTSLASPFPNIQDWRTYSEVWQAWRIQAERGDLHTYYCSREDQYVKIAHNLANQGRIYGWVKNGTCSTELVLDFFD